jgi:hypothetical protein
MRRARKDTVRKLYREGMLQMFGCGDKELDVSLVNAVKSDVHIAGKAPGQWISNEGVLEIYCENGIPNASDVHDFSWEAREFGLDPSTAVVYNSEKWVKLDKWVNLGLQAMGKIDRVHHEPHNSAVVGIYWSH